MQAALHIYLARQSQQDLSPHLLPPGQASSGYTRAGTLSKVNIKFRVASLLIITGFFLVLSLKEPKSTKPPFLKLIKIRCGVPEPKL